jgi:hypothetical protein
MKPAGAVAAPYLLMPLIATIVLALVEGGSRPTAVVAIPAKRFLMRLPLKKVIKRLALMRLPNFTPKRLVEEAVLSHNLRHQDQVDEITTPWPVLTNVVLAYLRHVFTDHDQQLSHAYDPELRDKLAAQVAKAAFQKYPWLRADPRPFPETAVSPLAFDEAATDLTDLYGQVDQVTRAIRDLRRQPTTPKIRTRIRDLSGILTGMRGAIADKSRLFTPNAPDTAGSYIAVRHPEHFGQYNFNGRNLDMNYLNFAGYKCPNCHYDVLVTKRPTSFGQGRKLNAYSCGCMTYAVDPPPPHYKFTVDLARWTAVVESTYTPETNQKT